MPSIDVGREKCKVQSKVAHDPKKGDYTATLLHLIRYLRLKLTYRTI